MDTLYDGNIHENTCVNIDDKFGENGKFITESAKTFGCDPK
jgi:hypothetical protein